MSHLPWFPFYHGDWQRSRKVRAMPRHIRSMFLDVLGELWEQGPISDDEATFCSLLGEDPKTFRLAWPKLRDALFEIEPGKLSNGRLEELRTEALAKSNKQSKRAKDGWDKRRAAMPRHSGGYAISDPTLHSKEISPAHEADPDHPPPLVAGFLGRLSNGWLNAGLPGAPGAELLRPLAQEIQRLELDPDRACIAWRDLLTAWRENRGVQIIPKPSKMLEHLPLVQQALAGELDPKQAGKAKRPDYRPPEPPAQRYEDAEAIIARIHGGGAK